MIRIFKCECTDVHDHFKIQFQQWNSQFCDVLNKIDCSKYYNFASSKDMFQPHLPVRLPCYDLAPVTSFALGRSLRLRTLGTPSFHGLTGGVYKARERIHRAMADARLLANPTSWSRVADSNPNYERFLRLASYHYVATLCTVHCNTCVALDVRAVLIWRHPRLPRTLRWQSR